MGVLEKDTNILLVSEDATHRQELYNILHILNDYVIIPTYFDECLAQIEKTSPALVIVDIRNNVASSQICVQIREKFDDDIILLAIIWDDVDSLQQALTAQVDDCVIWPISPVLLRRRIRSFLRVKRNRVVESKDQDQLEEKYRHLFNSANDAIFIVEMGSGRFLDVNRRAVKWLGYTLDEFLQMTYADIEVMPQEQLHGVNQQLSSTGHFIFEQQYKAKNRAIFSTEVSSRIFTYEGKRAVLNFVRDISKRKEAETNAEHQRLLAETLRDVAADLSSTLDLDEVLKLILQHVVRVVPAPTANIMLIEDGQARIVGYQNYEAYMDIDWMEIVSFDVRETHYMKWMIENLMPIVLPDTHDDPRWVYSDPTRWIKSFVAAPIIIKGEATGFINLDHVDKFGFDWDDAEDLMAFAHHASIAIQNARLHESVKKHAHELEQRVEERTQELELERAQLHAILNAITDGVVYQDNEGTPEYINQSLVRLTGYTNLEWIRGKKGWHDLSTEPEREIQKKTKRIHDILQRNEIWTGETNMRRKNNEQFDARLIVSNVIGADGQANGTVTVIRDISAAKRLEEQKARFISTASHELRTPITNIKTRLYLLQKQPERQADHMEVLVETARRMGKLVEDLLDVSRFEHGHIPLIQDEIVLQDVLNKVLFIQESELLEKNLQLKTNIVDTPLKIWGDQSRLLQVITNLLTNAINYTPENGEITITLKSDRHQYALIEVMDTGIGIPEESLVNIFTPFFRVSNDGKGAGLGLAISKEIIELHDGEIAVKSVPNQGTVFGIKLPLYTGGN